MAESARSNPTPLDVDDVVPALPWLQGIARSLVRDENEADDLVQETVLTALERPPAHRDGMRGWFRAVMRNVSYQGHRSDRRRVRREARVARPESQVDLRPAAEVSETEALVRSAVQELAEPYRSAVIARFYHELSTEEIARDHGVTTSAVRMRVKRGLAQVREKLETAFGSRRAMLGALVVFAGLGSGGAAAEGATGSTGDRRTHSATRDAVPPAAGDRVVVPVLAIGALLTVLVLLVTGLGGPSEAASGRGERAAAPRVATVSGASDSTIVGSLASDTNDTRSAPEGNEPGRLVPSATQIATLESTASLIVVGERAGDGAVVPIANARVTLTPAAPDGGPESTPSVHARTDANGRVDLPRARLRSEHLRISAPGYVEYRENVRLRDLDESSYRVTLEPVFLATLEVTNEANEPCLAAVRVEYGEDDTLDAATDASGQLGFPWRGFSPRIRVAAPGYADARVLATAPTTRVRLVAGTPAEGWVVDALGNRITGASVRITSPTLVGEPVRVETDARGEFRSIRLPNSGTARLIVAHPGFATRVVEFPLPWTPRAITLTHGAWISGIVVDPRGRAVATGEATLLRVNEDATEQTHHERARMAIDENGRFELGPVEPGEYTVAVEHPDYPYRTVDVGALGADDGSEVGTITVDLREGRTLRGRVVSESGAPVAGVRLRLTAGGSSAHTRRARSNADGSFEFRGVTEFAESDSAPDGQRLLRDLLGRERDEYTLEVQKPHELVQHAGRTIESLGLYGSGNSCRVRLEDRVELVVADPTGNPLIRFELRDRHDRVVRDRTYLLAVSREGWASAVDADVSGNPINLYDRGPLRDCLLWFMVDGYAWCCRDGGDLLEDPRLVVRLDAQRAEPVELRVVDADGAPVEGRHILTAPERGGAAPFGGVFLGTTDEDGIVTTRDLAPGRHYVFVSSRTNDFLLDKEPGYTGFRIDRWHESIEVPESGDATFTLRTH